MENSRSFLMHHPLGGILATPWATGSEILVTPRNCAPKILFRDNSVDGFAQPASVDGFAQPARRSAICE